mmetsp:Transcript_32867/g.75628  ORF Transcript_32867/g.75628 Transcript_32867/m.75628 type:complete len:87 (+) Transcript_32867:209-469(+)
MGKQHFLSSYLHSYSMHQKKKKKKSRVDYGRKHTTSGKKSYFLTLRGARFGTKTPRRKKNKKLLCSQEETVYLLDTHWQKNYMGSS